MKKPISILFMSLLVYSFAPAQRLNYYNHIAPIISRHCITCHKPDGAAPFSLASFNDVTKRALFIAEVVEKRYMPPYPADTSFVVHANANALSINEIATIKDWIANGKFKGKAESKKKDLAEKKEVIKKADITLFPKNPYQIPGDNKEKFKIFVLPTNTTEIKYVSAVEYVPGNLKRTHHSRIMIDTSNRLRKDNGIDIGDSSEYQKSGVKLFDEFWAGWLPGNNHRSFYPPGMAKILPPGTDLIINTHYAPGPLEEKDNFSVRLYFSSSPPQRIIKNYILDESCIVNDPFIIPADTIITFYGKSQPLPNDISLLSVLPHMHVLGKKFKAFAITPAGMVIPLISIPQWQFNWQLTYYFKSLLKIEKGSVIYIQATYDNTSSNPINFGTRPKPVSYGWGTKNEMMNLILEYVEYKSGDESISINNN